MAATDIKSVLELLRTKVHSADSSTSLDELNSMVKTAQLAHTPMIRHYDSDGSLPTATSSEERLAFITSTGSIKMNNGRRWEATTSSSSGGEAYSFQGSAYGYTTGGRATSPLKESTIEKHSFTADGNATDVGDLTQRGQVAVGLSSAISGYTAGLPSPPGDRTTIDKFPFSADGNATDVGDLTQSTQFYENGGGSSTETAGYFAGGTGPSDGTNIGTNEIHKISFSVDGNSTDVGDLTGGAYATVGQSSATHGYTSGGDGSRGADTIDKFPFASEGNATDVGNLAISGSFMGGASSAENGYTLGRSGGNEIQKFSFASDGNATDAADLTVSRYLLGGTSSTTSGYGAGGDPGRVNTIDKFPFAADDNATDVGDLTQNKRGVSNTGNQI